MLDFPHKSLQKTPLTEGHLNITGRSVTTSRIATVCPTQNVVTSANVAQLFEKLAMLEPLSVTEVSWSLPPRCDDVILRSLVEKKINEVGCVHAEL